MDPLTTQVLALVGPTIATVGISARFYLRYRSKQRAADKITAQIADVLIVHGPEGVEKVTPALALLVENAKLPVVRAPKQDTVPPPVEQAPAPPPATTGGQGTTPSPAP